MLQTVPTDDELMAAYRAGRRQAFDQLFERYREPVWAYFRRRVGDPARAEELAQDVFVAVLDGAKRYEPRGAFRSYLFGIAFRTLGASRRAARHSNDARPDRGRVFRPGEGGDEPTAAPADPTAVLWVRQALEELDAVDREMLMLREYEQLSYDDIARTLGTPVNTVRSRLFRARMALKAQLVGATERRRAEA